MIESKQFFMPTRLYQEKDVVYLHRNELAAYGKKAFLVTGKSSSKENGALDDVIRALRDTQTAYVLYDKIDENPSVETIMDAAVIGRKEGVDFVIGVGGGSPMDAAKAIALMIQNRDSSSDVLYQSIPLRYLPVVEIPTTCGTGSEVTPYAILTRDDIKTKQSIKHMIFPELALVDGKYLEKAPLSVIINTAIDALGHMIESYFHKNANDYSRMLCQYALEVWGMTIPVLLGSPAQEGQYEEMMFASSLAGMAIAHTGTSLPHGLSYYLTYHKGIPHGAAVGVFLPAYLSLMAEEMEAQVVMTLRALGFGSIEQFEGFIFTLLSRVELTSGEQEEMYDAIVSNPAKMSALPFSIRQDKVKNMIQSIVVKK